MTEIDKIVDGRYTYDNSCTANFSWAPYTRVLPQVVSIEDLPDMSAVEYYLRWIIGLASHLVVTAQTAYYMVMLWLLGGELEE